MQQEKAIKKLQSAIQAVQQAQEYVRSVLEDTDVGADYDMSFSQLIEDLSEDLDAIASGEVYEFRG